MAVATEYTKVAQELYLSYFGRPADSTGLASMTAALAAAKAPTDTAGLALAYKTNAEVKQLMDNFGTSAESAALYPGSTAEFVKGVYMNLFGRAPDAEGGAYWVKQIDAGTLSKGAAAYNILTGAIDAKGADSLTVAKKVLVASNFTAAIDTQAEITGYSGNAAAAEARKLLSNVNANTNDIVYQATVNSVLASLALGTTPGATIRLTAQLDMLVGTDANDTFSGVIFDNQNTLQGGDEIIGGGGNDTLRADVGDSQRFAFRAKTEGVENVVISAQAISTDKTDNNTGRTSEVQIDAERMNGVTRFEDSNSRADLLIEDIRILDSQITRDITIAMVQTDPGNVDFGVYFDQHSLRAAPVTASGATLRLQVMDTRASDLGEPQLKDQPYNGFLFSLDGKQIRVASEKIDQAQNYVELLAALKIAVSQTPGLQNFQVDAGSTFTVADTSTGRPQTGVEIVLTNKGAGTITLPKGSGWVAEAAVPPVSGLHTAILLGNPTSVVSKITSTVILDDVGRGSNGGDLVIGGLSDGDTSTSQGVQRFEITVERTSRLQTINSTDNILEEVIFVNGVTKGAVFVNGNANLKAANIGISGTPANGIPSDGGIVTKPGFGVDTPLPGTDTINGGLQHGDKYGFHDVRLIDASVMVGDVSLTAAITNRAVAKYINKVDTQSNSAADNVAFSYTGGIANDTMVVDLDAGVAGSRSQIVSGLEDFTFNLDGGTGNDALTLRIVPAAAGGGLPQFWNSNQDLNNNIQINGGDGNDTIRKLGDGDSRITGGAGDDTIYSENTGVTNLFTLSYGTNNLNQVNQPAVAAPIVPAPGAPAPVAVLAPTTAVWAFNVTNQDNVLPIADRFVGNMRSDVNDSYGLFNTKLNVTYKGITSTVDVANVNYRSTDAQINQAIKAAINDNPVLNKLLVAADGPAFSLTVMALSDGKHVVGDLSVGLVAPTLTLGTISAADIAAFQAAYGLTAGTDVYATILANIATFNTNLDYASRFATAYTTDVLAQANGATVVELTGEESLAISDNIITPGSGNDVIVLGNKETATVTPLAADYAVSNNETVVYAAGFGNDTIVNFDVTGAGVDHLDFTAIGGTTLTTGFTGDKSITIGAAVATALTTDAINLLYATANDKAQTHVYVAVNSVTNVGSVYSIADAAGAGGAVATLEGTIDLASTGTAGTLLSGTNLWANLTQANFVNSSAANYYLLEGAASVFAPVVVVPPVTSAFSVSPTATGVNAGNGVDATITVTGGATYNATVTNFAAGDKLVLPAGAVLTFDDTAPANEVKVIATTGALIQTITVQAPAAIGNAITDVATFNTAFGAGALTQAVGAKNAVAVNNTVVSFDAGVASGSPSISDYKFNVAAGTYNTTIANFNDGDVMAFIAGSAVTITNTAPGDNVIVLNAVNGATTTTITLTGIAGADDLAVGTSIANFNTTFGAGSLIIG
ncbi:DUF4214 domain-containing protein [Massilia aquatica]|uniref:DUF4214 domain-containing protein n=1 Tax=Massilia aquatica TaxID=2609000 RepID=A0ABX0M5W9_9BURK|nr:DUF4214 domain-containing protein [Massilia aquatica]NHZ38989.1 DUF4214 domain-containing protein [Massilia aquatica]